MKEFLESSYQNFICLPPVGVDTFDGTTASIDEFQEQLSLLIMNFNKIVQKYNDEDKGVMVENRNKKKEIQCHECRCYEHAKLECANTGKNKFIYVTWSDDSEIEGTEDEE
ncbi:hypothetical protein J1N35_023709 [Gossypium stocksii]|uniref:Uncharacterized protein n=1 Tax=Gossypium stocksii TaxID=47602 RepID=A0A9D4A3G0_9ROSI|nr:hypothetical protein J1N35_023709 [Gossypium stocksii]